MLAALPAERRAAGGTPLTAFCNGFALLEVLYYNTVMSPRLKILHILSSWESGRGNELAEFAARLSCGQFETEICTLSGKCRQVSGVPTTTLGLRWSFDPVAYREVGKVLRRFRPDVVHTWDAAAQLYGTLHRGKQRVIAEKRGTAVASDMLQKYLDQKTYRFIAPYKMSDCPKTVIIPPSAVPVTYAAPLSAEELLSQLDIPLAETRGNYYPVFQPHYEPERRNYKPMLPHPHPFLIGVVLPLSSEHRILDALWVFETFSHVHLNFHAFIIGDGKDREQFLRYRDRWKLFSRVHFIGNECHTHRLLPSLDVLLHLSPSAEHSGTILSAMTCGVPVVALETPESRLFLSQGKTGILIPYEGTSEKASRFYRRTAAKRVLHLLENKELRHSIRKAAQERVAKEFSFDAAVQRRIEVYRER